MPFFRRSSTLLKAFWGKLIVVGVGRPDLVAITALKDAAA